MLERVDEALWVVEGGVVDFFSFPYPTRSAIVRLAGGGLWIWSPIELADVLRAEVDRLGDVMHLVSPNKLHHLFLADWQRAYPRAKLWGPHSTVARHSKLAFEAPLEDAPPRAWADDIDQAWFRGSFAMEEIEFFHKRSRTAILADLVQAFDSEFLNRHWKGWRRPLARLDGITVEAPGAPRDWRLSFFDRKPARAARDKVLSWRCQRAIIAHGQWARDDGHQFLERSLSWL